MTHTSVQPLLDFIAASPSCYHVVSNLAARLTAAGYTPLSERDRWTLTPGGRYFVTRNSSSILAFRVPRKLTGGFMMAAAHSDSPAFKLKENAELRDFGHRLIMQSFVDMHLHAPQYPMLGMGMDLPLLDWLNTYTFPTEARFADTDYARRVYRRLATDLITSGTTRVCMFSSLHTDATLILMEELERAGVTGYVGKVNMDRNGLPGALQETTEESVRETLRWLDGCRFEHIKPIITPRFTPSCTDALMAALGKLAAQRGLYVQSHLSENTHEIAWVRELHPECRQYWETYDKYGLWKDHTVMAHCVHSDQRERQAIKDHGVVVVHCADSNVNICSGICPVRQMVNEGLWVTLGSDIAGGAQLPMYKVITMSIRTSKARRVTDRWHPDFLTVPEGYYLGTTSGHKYFGAGDGFAVGDKLHAVVI
ncbi:MAG: hypothetical protein BHW35_06550, partial [Firmicutes bacterium CAG:176_63_11]